MFLLLLAAGALYFATGKPGDALMLLSFVFVVMSITIIQERRTERALDALRDLSSPRALVLRDGQTRRIPGSEVVPGDFLIVAEGDRVPADVLLRRGTNVSTDESLLTGESVPVRKAPSQEAKQLERPGGDDLPSLFSGTLVTAGQGLCEAMSTGLQTELGRIGKALQGIAPDTTPLQTETGRIVRTLAVVGLAACAIVVVIYALTRGGTLQVWKDGMLAGIAMAMAILPEEFPVILTVFLAQWRMATLQEPGTHASDAGHRDARRSDRTLRRQDRHADREPHDAEPRCGRRADHARRRSDWGVARGLRRGARHRGAREPRRSLRSNGARTSCGGRARGRGSVVHCQIDGAASRISTVPDSVSRHSCVGSGAVWRAASGLERSAGGHCATLPPLSRRTRLDAARGRDPRWRRAAGTRRRPGRDRRNRSAGQSRRSSSSSRRPRRT